MKQYRKQHQSSQNTKIDFSLISFLELRRQELRLMQPRWIWMRLGVKTITCFIGVLGALVITGCTSFQVEPGAFGIEKVERDVKRFSELDIQEGVFKGWYNWTLLPNKNKTNYRLEKYQGKTVLKATANSSASGMAVPLKPRSVENLEISWAWKALTTIPGADHTVGQKDDAPLRLMLAFDGDKTKLPFKDQMAFEMAHLISGHHLPYATLMYVWSDQNPVDTIITNQHISRVRMLVVDSGQNAVGQWRLHTRHIGEDYRKVFNEPPGRLIGIGILTDSDNTNTDAQAIYGDIELIYNKTKKVSWSNFLK